MESNQVAESHDSKPLHPENTQNQESFGVQGSMSVAPPGLQSIDPQKTPFREQDGNQSPSMRANGQNFDNSLPQPLVPDHRLPGGLNEKRHQPLQPITNDSLGLGYNALITSQNAGENQQPGESLDPFQQPYLEAEKDNNQYFTSNKDAVQASLPGVVTGNLQSKTNQVPESTRMQQNQGISSPTTAGQKTSNQTLSVLLQIDGNKMMINKAPLKFIEDDEEAEEVQVLPILKFIVKKGQRIEGKITHLVKGDDDQAQLPTLIGIYNSTDAAQTTIGEDASVSLSEMEQVGKKYRLSLVVESQSQPSKPKTTNMPAPYSKPTSSVKLDFDSGSEEPQPPGSMNPNAFAPTTSFTGSVGLPKKSQDKNTAHQTSPFASSQAFQPSGWKGFPSQAKSCTSLGLFSPFVGPNSGQPQSFDSTTKQLSLWITLKDTSGMTQLITDYKLQDNLADKVMYRVFKELQAIATNVFPSLIKQGDNLVIYKVVIPVGTSHHHQHLQHGDDHAGIQRLRKIYESFMPVPNGYMVEWDISMDTKPNKSKQINSKDTQPLMED